MTYAIYIMATSAATYDAFGIFFIRRAFSTTEYIFSPENRLFLGEAERMIKPFDTDSVANKISEALGNKCKTVCLHSREENDVAYLRVVTSYEMSEHVLPSLVKIACEEDLLMFDPQTNNIFYRNVIDSNLIRIRSREKELFSTITSKMPYLWKVRKILSDYKLSYKSSAYVVMIGKVKGMTFFDQIKAFNAFLNENIISDEIISYDNKCFTVCGKGYEISFCLEGYKKNADTVGFMQDGEPRTALTRRMPCYQAFKWLSKHPEDRKVVYGRMTIEEMEKNFANPADRFVKSVNISKEQKKLPYFFEYTQEGVFGPGVGGEFSFSFIPENYEEWRGKISMIRIEEETASFILPFINDFYPYIYKRYYEKNNIPLEMLADITEKLKWAREKIIADPLGEDLAPYATHFVPYFSDGKGEQSIVAHKYDIAHLYDIFIDWATQLQSWGGIDGMFRISGP